MPFSFNKAVPVSKLKFQFDRDTHGGEFNTSYYLLGAGADQGFSTTTCAAGILGDDLWHYIPQIEFDFSQRTGLLHLNKTLPNGKYRLFACATRPPRSNRTIITDPQGLLLDGNGDGIPGDDYVLDFNIEIVLGIIVVNTTDDNITTDGKCTLREAILNANNNNWIYTDCASGADENDTIRFNIPGEGPHSIPSL